MTASRGGVGLDIRVLLPAWKVCKGLLQVPPCFLGGAPQDETLRDSVIPEQAVHRRDSETLAPPSLHSRELVADPLLFQWGRNLQEHGRLQHSHARDSLPAITPNGPRGHGPTLWVTPLRLGPCTPGTGGHVSEDETAESRDEASVGVED